MNVVEIGWKLMEVLSPVLVAALTWVSAKVAQLVHAKVKNEYLRGVLTRLDDAVVMVVRELYQVTVDRLKTASADGRLTPVERLDVKNAALESVRANLGPKGVRDLMRVLGMKEAGIDRFLAARIEAAVHSLKHPRMSSANGLTTGSLPAPA